MYSRARLEICILGLGSRMYSRARLKVCILGLGWRYVF